MTKTTSTFLGLDLGTSGLRALLVAQDGTTIATAEAPYSVDHPESGWSEQDPAHWLTACRTVISTLNANAPSDMSALAGIATAGHMHGATLLGADGTVLRPCILWNDTRSHAQAANLDADAAFHAQTGNIVFPGFTAPKLAWVAQHEPDIFAKTATVVLPKDYLTLWLTGQRVSEMSDASGTSWLNVHNRSWSKDLVARSGMTLDQMPKLHEGTDIVGQIDPNRAAELGLPATVKVIAGAADNAAAACGIGALTDGQGFVSLGTSGVILAGQSHCSPLPASAVHTFCHAVPDTWYQMGVILSATDCLNWLADTLKTTPKDLSSLLSGPLKPPGDLIFLPYLSGERTPHNDGTIRGAFIGLTIGTSQAELVQAVFEGVAFALRDCLAALNQAGTDLREAFVIGGGAQSAYWLDVIATVLNLDLKRPADGEFGAAMGAARLAICGATAHPVQDVMTEPKVQSRVHANTSLQPQFDAAYARYTALYPALKKALS